MGAIPAVHGRAKPNLKQPHILSRGEPNPMLELHKALTKILRDNNILTANQVEDQQKMAKIIDSMATVQQEILKSANNYKIKSLIEHMSSDLQNIIGGAVTEETQTIINTVSSNFEAMDSNFN